MEQQRKGERKRLTLRYFFSHSSRVLTRLLLNNTCSASNNSRSNSISVATKHTPLEFIRTHTRCAAVYSVDWASRDQHKNRRHRPSPGSHCSARSGSSWLVRTHPVTVMLLSTMQLLETMAIALDEDSPDLQIARPSGRELFCGFSSGKIVNSCVF